MGPRCAIATILGFVACAPSPEPTDPIYPTCPEIAATPLHEKAAWLDRLTIERHHPPGQDLIHSCHLNEALTEVDGYNLSDNAGGWSSVYGASQAFRWAVTKDPEALAQVKRILTAEETLMAITGVPGLFARAYVNLGVEHFPSEAQLLAEYPDCDLSAGHCKRWTKVESGPYAGFMFKNDASKDEYVTHLFALGVFAKLIDDAEVQARTKALLGAVGRHLIDNDLRILDIDGQPTEFGYLSPLSFNDFPGFNALLVLSWFRVIAGATGEPRFLAFYDDCLLGRDRSRCERQGVLSADAYPDLLDGMGLDLDCLTNWNNHHMAQLAMFSLLQWEPPGPPRAVYQEALAHQMWDADDPRPMREQQNALFTFFYEIQKSPNAQRPEAELAQAMCVMKVFPAEKYQRAIDNTGYPEVCKGRKDLPLTDVPVAFEEREIDRYIWKKNPYAIYVSPENRRQVESPEDYLLAYWVARYYGLVQPEL